MLTILTRWLRRPWLHFMVLGTLLYWFQQLWFPPPRPVIGPLPEARVDLLREQWLRATGSNPDAPTLARLSELELERDLLFQHALSLGIHEHDRVVRDRLLRNMDFLKLGEGEEEAAKIAQAMSLRLHLGDEVIKRRLIQVMEQLLLAAHPPATVEETDLRAAFEAQGGELREPPRYSLSQVYFNRDRESEAEPLLARIREQAMSPEEAITLGSPFLPGYHFREQSPDQLARQFGAAFVSNLQALTLQPQSWVGPVRSTYGLHLVWLASLTPGRPSTFEEVRTRLRRDLEREARREALATAVSRLRELYEVRS